MPRLPPPLPADNPAASPERPIRYCRNERVPSAHSYAELSISIRDQPCGETHVVSTGPTRWVGLPADYLLLLAVLALNAVLLFTCVFDCWLMT